MSPKAELRKVLDALTGKFERDLEVFIAGRSHIPAEELEAFQARQAGIIGDLADRLEAGFPESAEEIRQELAPLREWRWIPKLH